MLLNFYSFEALFEDYTLIWKAFSLTLGEVDYLGS